MGREGEKAPTAGQMRMKWESLQQEVSAKQKLLRDALAQEQEQVVPHVSLLCPHPLYEMHSAAEIV